MKQPKTFLLLSIIVSVLILGIAYAAITNIEFELTGNATAAPSQENFKVVFGKVGTTDAPTFEAGTGTSAGVKVTFEIKSDRVATMDVTGLKKVGDTVTATFKIINESTDLDAVLSDVIATGTNNYFTVTAKAIDKTILAKQKTNLEVTITLKKLPVTSNAVASIAVNFEAAPENPQSQGGNGDSAEKTVFNTIYLVGDGDYSSSKYRVNGGTETTIPKQKTTLTNVEKLEIKPMAGFIDNFKINNGEEIDILDKYNEWVDITSYLAEGCTVTYFGEY